jgi:hypothetical protein
VPSGSSFISLYGWKLLMGRRRLVSPADPSPSLSYPGGWHTTAFSRGSGERPRRRVGAAANGRREGGVGSDRARDGVAFPRGRSETRRKRRRPRSRAIEARAEVRRARTRRGTHSSRTPGVGAGGCTSRHREAPSLRISRRREWRERRGAARLFQASRHTESHAACGLKSKTGVFSLGREKQKKHFCRGESLESRAGVVLY